MFPPQDAEEQRARAYQARWRARQAATLTRAAQLTPSVAARTATLTRWAPWLWTQRDILVGDEDERQDRLCVNS